MLTKAFPDADSISGMSFLRIGLQNNICLNKKAVFCTVIG
jgi:hypothetical protein